MAKKRKKTQRKARRRQPPAGQGWAWGLLGLGVGLSVSAFIYLNSRPVAGPGAPAAVEPDTRKPAITTRQPAAETETEEPRFRFYEMLPTFEVVIPEEEAAVVTRTPQAPIDQPGIYVLQIGSFSKHADADRRRAELALLGVESGIQKVAVDDKVYHRVRVGPIDSLDELERLRSRLRGAQIEAMVIRVGE